MAYSDTPTDWIDSWSEDGTNISVPLASFNTDSITLTAAEADASTGDIAKIILAIVNKFAEEYEDKGDDVPTKMRISKSDSISGSTGTISYTFSFDVDATVSNVEVQSEA